MSEIYTFNIFLPTSGSELQSTRNFTVYPVYAPSLAITGITNLIGYSYAYLVSSIVNSSASVSGSATWYTSGSLSKYYNPTRTFDISIFTGIVVVTNPA